MCVDEEALTDELEKGRLFAFLDVSNRGARGSRQSAAAASQRRVGNSHVAGGRTTGRSAARWSIDIEAYLNGGSPLHPVTADMLERIDLRGPHGSSGPGVRN